MNDKSAPIHTTIRNYCHSLSKQIAEMMEYDLKSLIKDGYMLDKLQLCFYQGEPLHYSVRVDDRIVMDRWFKIDFINNNEGKANE